MNESLKALERLKEETQPNAYTLNHNEEDFKTIKQDLDLLNYLISLVQVKKGKIVIEIDKETNFETYTKIKEVLKNDR